MRRHSTAAVVAALSLTVAGCTSSSKPHSQPSVSVSGSGGGSASASPFPSPGATYKSPPPLIPVPGIAVTMSTQPAPWPPPAVIDQGKQSASYVAAAGLPYGEEMLSVHYHAHLDVIVDGKAQPVPAYIGFVAKGNSAIGLSALHTHSPDGIIHIENAVPATFLLGQFFTEWGVRFDGTCIGSYCAGNGKDLAVFVNGTRYSGDPRRLVLAKHQEIAVVYGDTGKLAKPPASYKFPTGD